MRKRAQEPSRKVILKRIKEDLDGIYGWGRQIAEKEVNVGYTENALKYLYHAEALIELLEVQDCGSTGGFDGRDHGLYSLEQRYEHLRRKYK